MSSLTNAFHFKQFSVDQSGCGMKVNTDGVLLGALVHGEKPSSILDIGTGTGVVAMMLAQRFSEAIVEAVEIEEGAAKTAQKNFWNSPFSHRLAIHNQSFQDFSEAYPDRKFELIVSNPPFFTNSLKNPDYQKQLARHTNGFFFKELAVFAKKHLSQTGRCSFIIPLDAAKVIIAEGYAVGLQLQHILNIKSSPIKAPHRQLITLSVSTLKKPESFFTIYHSEKVYSDEYRVALQDFLTIF